MIPRHDNEDAKRCTYEKPNSDGTKTRCGDSGAWTLDKRAKTWRSSKPADKARRCWNHGPGLTRPPVGKGGQRKIKPNARTQRTALLLMGTSRQITEALVKANDELSMLGFPGSSSKGVSYTATDDDPVGGDAARIVDLTGWREDLRDTIDDLGHRVDALIRLVRADRRSPLHGKMWAFGAKLCVDGLDGRAGAIEWGDYTCTELPTRSGLCAACWQRERRWREANDLNVDVEAAA